MMDVDQDHAVQKGELNRGGDCASETIPCAQCALDVPCPMLSAAREHKADEMDLYAAAPTQEKARPPPVGDCASEAVPCEQCSLDMPCPMLSANAAQSASHIVAATTSGTPEQDFPAMRNAMVQSHTAQYSWEQGGMGSAPAHNAAQPWLPRSHTRLDEGTSHIWRSMSRRALSFAGEMKRIPVERLQLHRKKDSCWIVASGRVVDATMMLRKHPAGPEIILKYAGRDCTDDVQFHSKGAQKMWARHVIGVLDTAMEGSAACGCMSELLWS